MIMFKLLFVILTTRTLSALCKNCLNNQSCFDEANIKQILANPFLQSFLETKAIQNNEDDTYKKGQNGNSLGKSAQRSASGAPGPSGPSVTKNMSAHQHPAGTQFSPSDHTSEGPQLDNLQPKIVSGVKGEQGSKGGPGIRGSPGKKGPRSVKGRMGLSGERGDIGRHGEPGKIGEAGPDGLTGLDGLGGAQGERGARGFSMEGRGVKGEAGSSGPKGNKGDTGDMRTYVIFMPASAGNASGQLKVLRKPARDGAKSSPGRTCADIKEEHPRFPSGAYWIDPNGGGTDDAIEVSCDMFTGATCISAFHERPPDATRKIDHSGDYSWLSEMPKGLKVKYNASISQIKFLQLLCPFAEQSVQFGCSNSESYFDSIEMNCRSGVKVLGWYDSILTDEVPNRNLRYEELPPNNDLNSQDGHPTLTTITYETNKSNRLPFVDVAVRDFGADDEFPVEISPVCFRKHKRNYAE